MTVDYRSYYANKDQEAKKMAEMASNEELKALYLKEKKQNRMYRFCLVLTSVAAVLGVGSAVVCHRDMMAMKDMISDSVARLSDVTSIEVDESVVNKAVSDAADRVVNSAVKSAVSRVESTYESEIRRRVMDAVRASQRGLTDKVADKLSSEVADINRQDIIDDVMERTTDKLTEKIEDDLGDEVGKVGEIYKNIIASLRS